MKLDQKLIDAAIDFVNRRFPAEPWAGSAAMYTEDGKLLISTAPECVNGSAGVKPGQFFRISADIPASFSAMEVYH